MVNSVTELLNITYPTQRGVRNRIIEDIIDRIKQNSVNLGLTRDELYLVIDEAITNAMEHGNAWNSEKKVRVQVRRNEMHLEVLIEDEGTGFNSGTQDKSINAIKNLKPRGRGIYIIKQFCKPFWNDKGNMIGLRFPIPR